MCSMKLPSRSEEMTCLILRAICWKARSPLSYLRLGITLLQEGLKHLSNMTRLCFSLKYVHLNSGRSWCAGEGLRMGVGVVKENSLTGSFNNLCLTELNRYLLVSMERKKQSNSAKISPNNCFRSVTYTHSNEWWRNNTVWAKLLQKLQLQRAKLPNREWTQQNSKAQTSFSRFNDEIHSCLWVDNEHFSTFPSQWQKVVKNFLYMFSHSNQLYQWVIQLTPILIQTE